VEKIISVVSKMKDGDLIDSFQLTHDCGWINAGRLAEYSAHPALGKHKHRIAARNWWGNERTIEELKKKY
jgi:hypothetical protein